MREKLMEEILKQCEKTMKGWNVTSRLFTKNNHVELHGIVIKRNDVPLARIVYLERLEEILGDTFTVEEACAYIQEQLLDHPEFSIPQNLYTEWDYVKESIRKKLVNYAQNEECLKGILHRKYLDLADRNMALEGYQMETMESLLCGYEVQCLEGIEPMYIVHNSAWEFGAVILTRTDMIKELLNGKGGNYYIFPCSTQEIILKTINVQI